MKASIECHGKTTLMGQIFTWSLACIWPSCHEKFGLGKNWSGQTKIGSQKWSPPTKNVVLQKLINRQHQQSVVSKRKLQVSDEHAGRSGSMVTI